MNSTLIADRYRILEPLGYGGMAVVYRAFDKKNRKCVALKQLHNHLSEHQGVRKRFHLEAKIISQLSHPNIVKFFDYSGEQSKDLWIAMELLRGVDLINYIKQSKKGYLSPLHSILIVNDVAAALKVVHKHEVVHRDIKPENIMVLQDSSIKLMDFGIAKDFKVGSLTQVGDFLGSPNYMSPEQIRGSHQDDKSDIYSLGVLLFCMLTGKLPFDGKTRDEVCMKILLGRYLAPNEIITGMDPIIVRIVTRCLAMKPSQRYRDIDDLIADIGDYLALSSQRRFSA